MGILIGICNNLLRYSVFLMYYDDEMKKRREIRPLGNLKGKQITRYICELIITEQV